MTKKQSEQTLRVKAKCTCGAQWDYETRNGEMTQAFKNALGYHQFLLPDHAQEVDLYRPEVQPWHK